MKKPKDKSNHDIAMEIVKILIDSGLSINNQLKVIQAVKGRLNFIKLATADLVQKRLDL